MKVLVCGVILIIVIAVQAEIQPFTFQQTTDHFNAQDQSTFQQFSWFEPAYYKAGGPVILYLSSFPAPRLDLAYSAVVEWAQALNGVAAELEVRYSGSSNPGDNFSTDNLQFQSPEQNLADIVTFRVAFVRTFPEYQGAPWIVVGEYFNGNYAIWAREKYPDVIIGAVGIGAPVFAIEDFEEYYQYWSMVAGDACSQAIHSAIVETELAIDNNPTDTAEIFGLFGCPDMQDVTDFFYVLAQLTQYGIAYQRDSLCDPMFEIPYGTSYMNQYAECITTILEASGVTDCYSWSLGASENVNSTFRPTFYLDCTAFGQFNTAGPTTATTIVSQRLDVEWYLDMCSQVFETVLIPNTEETNIVYGAKYPWGSNYAFVSTLSDPYYFLEVNDTSLSGSEVYNIPTTESIFSFLSGENPSVPIALARDSILDLMYSWLPPVAQPSPSTKPTPTQYYQYYEEPEHEDEYLIALFSIIGILCLLAVSILSGFVIMRAVTAKIQQESESVDQLAQ